MTVLPYWWSEMLHLEAVRIFSLHLLFDVCCRGHPSECVCVSVGLKMSLKRRLLSVLLCCVYCVASLFCLHPHRHNCFSPGARWVWVSVRNAVTDSFSFSVRQMEAQVSSVFKRAVLSPRFWFKQKLRSRWKHDGNTNQLVNSSLLIKRLETSWWCERVTFTWQLTVSIVVEFL